MSNAIKFLLTLVAFFLIVIVYSCAVVAGSADEQLESMRKKIYDAQILC